MKTKTLILFVLFLGYVVGQTNVSTVRKLEVIEIKDGTLEILCDPSRGNHLYIVRGRTSVINYSSTPIAISVIHQPGICK